MWGEERRGPCSRPAGATRRRRRVPGVIAKPASAGDGEPQTRRSTPRPRPAPNTSSSASRERGRRRVHNSPWRPPGTGPLMARSVSPGAAESPGLKAGREAGLSVAVAGEPGSWAAASSARRSETTTARRKRWQRRLYRTTAANAVHDRSRGSASGSSASSRVWGGIHFRTADVQGAVIGKEVARYLRRHYFQAVD
jgi:hypothetical protein